MSIHDVFAPGRTAVITGGASGIGLATARHCASQGMNVVLADLAQDTLATASAAVREVVGAWTPEQVVERMVDTLQEGGFYILCPDNETTSEMDVRRIMWGAGDVAFGRPALSRWHPDFAEAFAAHMAAPVRD